MSQLGPWWTWAAGVAGASLGTAAAETAVPEHSVHALGRRRHGSCGDAEPYRPAGYDGRSYAEQSRPLQTFGEQSQGTNGVFQSLQSVSVCVASKPGDGAISRARGSLTGRPTTRAARIRPPQTRIRQPGSGPGAKACVYHHQRQARALGRSNPPTVQLRT